MSEPIYTSPRSSKSVWQEYRVYPDRVQHQSWFALHTLVIPADEIVDIQIRPPLVYADLFRGKGFVYAFPAKLDCADTNRHVAIKRKFGFMKHVRFTPDDPEKFVEACKSIMKKD